MIQNHCSQSFKTVAIWVSIPPPPILQIRETTHEQTEVNSEDLQTCFMLAIYLTSLMIRSLKQGEYSSVFQSHHVLDINKVIKNPAPLIHIAEVILSQVNSFSEHKWQYLHKSKKTRLLPGKASSTVF